MRRVFEGAEIDVDGRIVIRIGGECPICGNGPDITYSGDGRVVLYHLPTSCAAHMRNYKAAYSIRKQAEVNDSIDDTSRGHEDRRYGT